MKNRKRPYCVRVQSLTKKLLFFTSGEPLSFGNCFTAFLCVIAGVCAGALLFTLEMLSKAFGVGTSILGSYGAGSASGVSAQGRTVQELMDFKDDLIKEMAEDIGTLKEALKGKERWRTKFDGGGGGGEGWMIPPTRSVRSSRLRL